MSLLTWSRLIILNIYILQFGIDTSRHSNLYKNEQIDTRRCGITIFYKGS